MYLLVIVCKKKNTFKLPVKVVNFLIKQISLLDLREKNVCVCVCVCVCTGGGGGQVKLRADIF